LNEIRVATPADKVVGYDPAPGLDSAFVAKAYVAAVESTHLGKSSTLAVWADRRYGIPALSGNRSKRRQAQAMFL
jgi:hypothetical protein